LNNDFSIIDLFAGPGGLGEGFSKKKTFGRSLSIEMDPVACVSNSQESPRDFRSIKITESAASMD